MCSFTTILHLVSSLTHLTVTGFAAPTLKCRTLKTIMHSLLADIPSFTPSQFVPYIIADNVDHNIRTLDGNDTFHGMGMIAAVTPGFKRSNPIIRVKVTAKDIASVGHVSIQYHREESLMHPRNSFPCGNLPVEALYC